MLWCIVVLATCFKILLIKTYYSTDFEVHRHWLALTSSRPWKFWYTDTTSQWTLDYPPFFAWFEWCLSLFASVFDPNMLRLSSAPYTSEGTLYFLRLTVIASDFVLFYGVYVLSYYLTTNPIRKCSQYKARWKSPTTIFQVLVLGNMGLLLVDHIHFQYNGLLLGILLLSISHILNGRHCWAAFWFIFLIHMKHIFMYMAPVFFIYLLRNHCMVNEGDRLKWEWRKAGVLATIVLAVTAVSCGPYILAGQFFQLLSRLFPFKRGLTHAYWAPNVWAIYNFCDKFLCFFAHRLGYQLQSSVGHLTGGLVSDSVHLVLPTITPKITFILTALAIVPCLIKLWKSAGNPLHFVRALVLCTTSAFLFGWHVHEKAILMVIIPHSLLAVIWRKEAETYAFLSTVGHYSLLPLLFTTKEILLKYLLFILQTWYTLTHLRDLFHAELLCRRETLYLYGLFGISVYDIFGVYMFPFLKDYQFLPLMISSVYCSLGITYVYLKYYFSFVLSSATNKRVTF
ncbi:ALG6/ALG8 family glucosyltransferase xit [Rhodnius prolixus]|uniref:Alpha-1,3-glucosyltransferase n=3 Tax=Rhodnius TaxID=13248 RepID=R4G404_RHOPR